MPQFRQRRHTVFCDRFGPQASLSESSFSKSASSKPPRRKNWAALGLAVALAAPVGAVQLSRLYAQDVSGPVQSAGPAHFDDLVKLGRTQFDAEQYEDAQKTLAAVNT